MKALKTLALAIALAIGAGSLGSLGNAQAFEIPGSFSSIKKYADQALADRAAAERVARGREASSDPGHRWEVGTRANLAMALRADPTLSGDALQAARMNVAARMGALSEILDSDVAADIAQTRWASLRLDAGVGDQPQAARRWGITILAIEAYEKSGNIADALGLIKNIVAIREKLQAEVDRDESARDKLRRLAADFKELFGRNVADAIFTLTSADIARAIEKHARKANIDFRPYQLGGPVE